MAIDQSQLISICCGKFICWDEIKLSLGEKCCWHLKINDPEIHSILIIPCEFFWNITYREILGVIKRHSRWIYPHCELISAASVWQQNAVMEDKRTWTLTQSLLFYLPEQTREHSLRHHDFVNKSNGDQWNFSSFWKWFSQGFFN